MSITSNFNNLNCEYAVSGTLFAFDIFVLLILKIQNIMISEKLVKAFNDQIVAELWSSNLYLQMAFYLKKEGWNGSANWMFKQADEEKEHALKLADYAIKRGGEVKVGMIDVVPDGWGSLQDVFQNVYEHECHVSGLVNDLVDLASAERDKATQDFLWGFVREQVEEEDSALTIVERLKRAGEAGAFFVDAELAKR